MFSIISAQLIKMLIILLVGVICYRTHLVSETENKALANLLLFVANPVLALMSLQTDYNIELVRGLLLSFAIAIFSHLVMVFLTNLLIKEKDNADMAVERFSAMYANVGFMGVPLAQSFLGSEGVLYMTAYMTTFNLFSWTHGLALMAKKGEPKSVKTVLKGLCTPMVIACGIGLVLFFLQIRLPALLADCLDSLGSLNTPLAMLVAGISVAQTNLPSLLKNRRMYVVAAIKLFLMPVPTLLLLFFSPVAIPQAVAYTAVVAASAPVAATCTAFAIRHNKNYTYASELYSFTTLCSIITIPVFVVLTEQFLV